MNSMQAYIAVSILVLFGFALGYFFINKSKKTEKLSKLSKLSKFAFTFILAGIIFGEDKFIGYGLIGIGMIFAVADMAIKLKKIKKN